MCEVSAAFSYISKLFIPFSMLTSIIFSARRYASAVYDALPARLISLDSQTPSTMSATAATHFEQENMNSV